MELYDPFEQLSFSDKECFLCGVKTDGLADKTSVFPEWLMETYKLHKLPFKLLDESVTSYGAMQMPCCGSCKELYLDPLEQKISMAFSNGYAGVRALDESDVFLWFSKLLYGIIWIELQAAFTQHEGDEPLGISPSLLAKFKNLHLLLQSLRVPILFEEFEPWSLILVKLEPAIDYFDYRDEMATMIFSMAMADFGLLICLQDHGQNLNYHASLLKKHENKPLELIQFQELCALFYYSAYLFNPIPEYLVLPPVPGQPEFTISAQPLEGVGFRPLFNAWNNSVYAQVLEAFWKPFNISKAQILADPQSPLTRLA